MFDVTLVVKLTSSKSPPGDGHKSHPHSLVPRGKLLSNSGYRLLHLSKGLVIE